MRTIILLLASMTLLLWSCEREEIPKFENPLNLSLDTQENAQILAYNLESNIETKSSKIITVGELKSIKKSHLATRSFEKASANGHFNTPFGSILTFSAILNNGGAHGQAQLTNEVLDVKMKTTCVASKGNKAVFQGEITSGHEGTKYKVGNTLIIYVEDLGEGSKAPFDRYSSNLYLLTDAAPSFLFDCQLWLDCADDCWGESIEVAYGSDQIQVK